MPSALPVMSDAERLDEVDLLVERRLGQAVLGDAVAHHAAGVVLLLEDRDVVAGDREVVGGGEARGAGADDGDALARRLGDARASTAVLRAMSQSAAKRLT